MTLIIRFMTFVCPPAPGFLEESRVMLLLIDMEGCEGKRGEKCETCVPCQSLSTHRLCQCSTILTQW